VKQQVLYSADAQLFQADCGLRADAR